MAEMTQRNTLTFFVPGNPAPQGSKQGFAIKKGGAYTGKVAMIESSGTKLDQWRADVRHAAMEAAEEWGWETATGPVRLDLNVILPRPKSHYRTGKHSGLLKDSAPTYPATTPDRDKLERAVVDALDSAGVFADDKLIVGGHTQKAYVMVPSSRPGAMIEVTTL